MYDSFLCLSVERGDRALTRVYRGVSRTQNASISITYAFPHTVSVHLWSTGQLLVGVMDDTLPFASAADYGVRPGLLPATRRYRTVVTALTSPNLQRFW